MFKRFIKDSVIYGLSTFFARVVIFLLLPLYTRLLKPEDFGVIEILTIFGNFINVTVALEISQALVRHYPDAPTKDDKLAYATTSFWFTVFAYTVFLAACSLLSRTLSFLLLSEADRQGIFLISLVATWCYGLFYLVQNQLRVELRSMQYAISNLVMNLIAIGSTLILVLVWRWGVIGVAAGQLIGNMVGCILSIYFARNNYLLSFDWIKLKEMLSFSWPLVLSSVGSAGILYANRFVLGDLLALSDVGLLSVAYRVVAPINLLVISVQNAATPIIYSDYRKPDAPRELARVFHFFMAMALLAFVTMSLFSQELFKLMASREYQSAVSTTPYLVASALVAGMTLFTPGLYIGKNTMLVAGINILGGILTIVFSYILVFALGLNGAAIATLLGNAFVFFLSMRFSQKYYQVPYNFGRVSVAILFSILILAAGSLLQDANLLSLLWRSLLLASFAASMVLLKLIEKEKIALAFYEARVRLLILQRLLVERHRKVG